MKNMICAPDRGLVHPCGPAGRLLGQVYVAGGCTGVTPMPRSAAAV